MFKTILVPTDGSELAEKAVDAAVDFAKSNNSRLIGLSVAAPFPYSPLAEPAFVPDPSEYDKAEQERVQQSLDRLTAAAARAGVQCETVSTVGFDPSEEIIQAAEEHGCDSIFIASHGRKGLDRILLGSVTQKVLLKSKIPVVVFR